MRIEYVDASMKANFQVMKTLLNVDLVFANIVAHVMRNFISQKIFDHKFFNL